jgi:hypothetical protein
MHVQAVVERLDRFGACVITGAADPTLIARVCTSNQTIHRPDRR